MKSQILELVCCPPYMNYAQPRFWYMHLHKKLAQLRHQKGLKQTEMAKKVNMTTDGYAKLERGERQLKIPRLEQIAAALEITSLPRSAW